MVKRTIGIDLNATHIHAVQMSRRAEGFHVEKVFFDDDPSQCKTPSEWLQFLIAEHGFARRSAVAWSMPHDKLFFRREQTDNTDRELGGDPLRSDIEDDFPLPVEDTVTAVGSRFTSTDNTTGELVTAVARSTLREQLTLTENSKARNMLLEAPIFAVYNSVAFNHPDILTAPAILVYTETLRSLIAITDKQQVLCVRNLPNPSVTAKEDIGDPIDTRDLLLREIELTWRCAREEPIPEDTPLVLTGRAAADTELQNHLAQSLPCRIHPLNPLARTVGSMPKQSDTSFCIAEGLALRALRPDDTLGVNLLHSQARQSRKPVSLKKQLLYSFILLGVLGAVYLGSLFYRLAKLEGQYTSLKGESRQVFQQTLPEETTIVNELAQMQTRLQEYQESSGLWQSQSAAQADPLDVLHKITVNTPSNLGLTIQDIYIANNTVRLTAVCNSFQDAYDWQAILKKQGAFASVDMQDPKKQSQSEAVQFVLLMELKSEL